MCEHQNLADWTPSVNSPLVLESPSRLPSSSPKSSLLKSSSSAYVTPPPPIILCVLLPNDSSSPTTTPHADLSNSDVISGWPLIYILCCEQNLCKISTKNWTVKTPNVLKILKFVSINNSVNQFVFICSTSILIVYGWVQLIKDIHATAASTTSF